VRVEAGANLVFAVTLGKNVTPTQLSWYDNGLTAARAQAVIDTRNALISRLVDSRIGDQRIALIPPVTTVSLAAYRLGGLLPHMDVISDQQFVDPSVFNATVYPVAFYTGSEDYIRTVSADDDGEQAIRRYLSQGGVLVFAAPMGGNWPMYYAIDNGVRDDDDPLLPRLGIPMYGPWESPPGPLTVNFSAMQSIVTGLPASFPYPTSGDLRLRLADLARVKPEVSITPILTIDGLGSPAFLAKFVSGSMKGGQVLYIWSRFLDQSYSDTIYESVIKFIANQYTAAPASLTVTLVDDKVVLNWSAGIPGNHAIAGYGIYKSDTSGTYPSTPTATVDASTLTRTDTAPAPGTNTYYTVRAIDSGTPTRTSGSSPEASVIMAFRITAPSTAHGTLGVPDALLPRGTSTTVAVHPAQGWRLSALLDNNVDVTSSVTSAGYVITDIQTDHVLTAAFAAIPMYTLTPTAGTGGTITPGVPQTVVQGGGTSFLVIPDAGYDVASVTIDGVSQGAISSYTFTNVTSNHTISARFEKKQTVLVLQIGNSVFTVNDSPMTLDSRPIIKNGRTLVPIRAIIEALGGTVDWDGTARKATVDLGSTSLELWIGKNTATVNGTDTPIDSTNAKVFLEIINSRTMLPLRFVTENLGATVSWEQSTQTITITYQP
ncbi:MAG: stalk domain-containing protein, partial [Candidatus Cryosericum sp.]